MVVSFKDSVRLIGLIIVVFCAVFVCTFFLNFYMDAQSLEGTISDAETLKLYNAQMAMAKFTCAISGGFLGLIAVVMLVFYIKLFIDGHAKQLGILKAMGYSDFEVALRFAVFGLSVLIGGALGFGGGFIFMPTVYKGMTINGLPEISITFHFVLLITLVLIPAIVFAALSCLFAYLSLRRPVLEMLRGKSERIKISKGKSDKERGFLKEMCFKTLGGKKTLAFFVAFACFCFSAMVQMAASMYELSTETMGIVIFVIGVTLALTTIFMAVTSLVNSNVKNISVMKAFGYTTKECSLAVLGGYVICAAVGFAVGTVYQHGLLSIMVNVVFKDVGSVPDYSFNVPVFFITLAAFIVLYAALMMLYTRRMNKISVKEAMMEN